MLKHPDAKIISLGIGDTTEPIPEFITSAMAKVMLMTLVVNFVKNMIQLLSLFSYKSKLQSSPYLCVLFCLTNDGIINKNHVTGNIWFYTEHVSKYFC